MNKFEILDGLIQGIFGDVFILVKIKSRNWFPRRVAMWLGSHELDWI